MSQISNNNNSYRSPIKQHKVIINPEIIPLKYRSITEWKLLPNISQSQQQLVSESLLSGQCGNFQLERDSISQFEQALKFHNVLQPTTAPSKPADIANRGTDQPAYQNKQPSQSKDRFLEFEHGLPPPDPWSSLLPTESDSGIALETVYQRTPSNTGNTSITSQLRNMNLGSVPASLAMPPRSSLVASPPASDPKVIRYKDIATRHYGNESQQQIDEFVSIFQQLLKAGNDEGLLVRGFDALFASFEIGCCPSPSHPIFSSFFNCYAQLSEMFSDAFSQDRIIESLLKTAPGLKQASRVVEVVDESSQNFYSNWADSAASYLLNA